MTKTPNDRDELIELLASIIVGHQDGPTHEELSLGHEALVHLEAANLCIADADNVLPGDRINDREQGDSPVVFRDKQTGTMLDADEND